MIVKNDIEELKKLYGAVDEIAAQYGMDEAVVNDLYLCLDEVFSNIVNYAFDSAGHDIEAQFLYDETQKKIKIAFIDKGKAFNPLEAAEPDLSLDLLEREIGGLGIFIVSNLMSSVEYSRLDDKNKLEMTKEL